MQFFYVVLSAHLDVKMVSETVFPGHQKTGCGTRYTLAAVLARAQSVLPAVESLPPEEQLQGVLASCCASPAEREAVLAAAQHAGPGVSVAALAEQAGRGGAILPSGL